MSYDRFSSWSNEIEPDQPEEPVSPSPEPVQPSSDLSAEDILSDLEALDSGESYEAEVGPRVFDEVYLQMKRHLQQIDRPTKMGFCPSQSDKNAKKTNT